MIRLRHRVTDIDHRSENCVPGFLLKQLFIGEHATVPANMRHAALIRILEPVTGALCDVQFSVGIVSRTKATRLLVIARSVNGTIVLCNVEISGPRT